MAIRAVEPSPGTLPLHRDDEVASGPRRADVVRSRLALAVSSLRGRHLFAIDLIGMVIAAFLAMAFRDDAQGPVAQIGTFAPILLILILARTIANIRSGLYTHAWRYASVPELRRILVAAIVGTVFAFLIVLGLDLGTDLPWVAAFPRSFWAAELLVTLAVVGGLRFTIRSATEWEPRPVASPKLRPTLFYGAGRTGVLMAAPASRKPDAGVVRSASSTTITRSPAA